MEKLSGLFRALQKALAMARNRYITNSSPKPFFSVVITFSCDFTQPPLKMRKFCENNFRKFPVSSKLMNPAFPVDLHPESRTSPPPWQTPMIPTPFPPAPSHACLSPWAQPQPWQLCCCRRAASDHRPSPGEGGDFGSVSSMQ